MKIRVAMTGFGNVGRGVATLLLQHTSTYAETYGIELVLSGIADAGGSLIASDGVDLQAALDAKLAGRSVAQVSGGRPGVTGIEMLALASPDVFVEAASTNYEDAEPSWSTISAAQAAGLDVVLASKGALVLHFRELMDEARAHGTSVAYSATVGAPLPSLEIMRRALAGTHITGFEAIVNSTANVILAAMVQGNTYEEGVRLAREMGIAETDPTLDVDGWDAAAKAAILANTAFGSNLTIYDVAREGIRDLHADDLQEARSDGTVLKLVSSAQCVAGNVSAQVRVQRRSMGDALGRLQGPEPGIVIHTEPLGDFSAGVENFSGVSGGIVTAATVLRDVLNLVRDRRLHQ